VTADFEHAHGSFLGQLVQRQPRLPLTQAAHAAACTGSRKKRCAFRQRTPSRHSAGN
jgi:hypothetical protein